MTYKGYARGYKDGQSDMEKSLKLVASGKVEYFEDLSYGDYVEVGGEDIFGICEDYYDTDKQIEIYIKEIK